nr:ATP-binding protein [Pontibacillus marinus]
MVLRSEKGIQKFWGNVWVLFGSLIFGLGIWSMHSIGMLAYSLPVSTKFNWVLIILSLLFIVCTSVFAFFISYKKKQSSVYQSLSTVLTAVGIITTHFIGMESLKFQGLMEYSLISMLICGVLSLLFSGMALFSLFSGKLSFYVLKKYKWVFAILVGLGISSVHYIALSGTSFFVDGTNNNIPPQEAQGSFITNGIIVSIMILLLAILFLAYFDKYKALKNSIDKDQQYLALYYNSPNLLCTITSDGNIYNANTPFVEKIGVIPGENNKFPSLFLNPVYIEEQINEAMLGNHVHYQAQMISKQSKILQVDVTHIPIKVDRKVTGITAVIEDVTEVIEAKKFAEEKMYLKEAILKTLSEGLFVYDTDGNPIRLNHRAAEILKISFEDVSKINPFKTDLPFVDEQGKKLPKGEWPAIKVLKEHKSFNNYILGILQSDNEIQWLSINASPLIMHGKVAGAVVTFTDVTEMRDQSIKLKRANQHLKESIREAIQANQVKTEFLSRMSHELRTPLNSIIGYSELLMEGKEASVSNSSKQYDQLQKIHRSGVHLLHLINEILDLSKIEKGEFAVREEWINVEETVRDAVDIIGPMATEKNVHVSCELMDDREWGIQADPLYLRQILVNLLSNALKYNKPNGKVSVYQERDGDSIKICIQDNGIGIKSEYIPHLFDSFYRVPNQEVSGTGIGLSIVKRLVEKMNGSCGVQSKENEGSKFWVSFPLKNRVKEFLKV